MFDKPDVNNNGERSEAKKVKLLFASDSFKGTLSSEQTAVLLGRAARCVFDAPETDSIQAADGGEGTAAAVIDAVNGQRRDAAGRVAAEGNATGRIAAEGNAAGRMVCADVHDPLMRPISAQYGIISDDYGLDDPGSDDPGSDDTGSGSHMTAVIEMAAASGLTLLSEEERDPLVTSTFGTGELVLDALDRGCRNFVMAIGGSATNDGGTGFLRALGVRLLSGAREEVREKVTEEGKELIEKDEEARAGAEEAAVEVAEEAGAGAEETVAVAEEVVAATEANEAKRESGKYLKGRGCDLEYIAGIDASGLDPRIRESKFTVMCDVTNPLCGREGATMVFGPQKGADPDAAEQLERGMCNWRDVIKEWSGIDCDEVKGAGAAGGLGAALYAFLGAQMRSGIDTLLDLAGFEERIEGCSLVVTGEGRTDMQSAYGKVISAVGDRARKKGVPVVALSGSLGEGYEAVFEHGIKDIYITKPEGMPLREAMHRAEELYFEAAVRMFRSEAGQMTRAEDAR